MLLRDGRCGRRRPQVPSTSDHGPAGWAARSNRPRHGAAEPPPTAERSRQVLAPGEPSARLGTRGEVAGAEHRAAQATVDHVRDRHGARPTAAPTRATVGASWQAGAASRGTDTELERPQVVEQGQVWTGRTGRPTRGRSPVPGTTTRRARGTRRPPPASRPSPSSASRLLVGARCTSHAPSWCGGGRPRALAQRRRTARATSGPTHAGHAPVPDENLLPRRPDRSALDAFPPAGSRAPGRGNDAAPRSWCRTGRAPFDVRVSRTGHP